MKRKQRLVLFGEKHHQLKQGLELLTLTTEQLIRSAKRGMIRRNRGTVQFYIKKKLSAESQKKERARKKEARLKRLKKRLGEGSDQCCVCQKVYPAEKLLDYISETTQTYCETCHSLRQFFIS
jgi:CII-binding regulator of phage lambda lysogenization HflD